MMTRIRGLLALAALLTAVQTASAFTFNPNTHLQVYYVFCGREVYVDFVYLQLQGDNDKMVNFYFRNNPSSGAPDTILIFKHESHFNGETGWMFFDTLSPHDQFGYKTRNSANGFNWNISFVQRWEQNDAEGQKRWVRFKVGSLPANSSLELFTVNGLWDGQGSNSPNVTINTTHPITITGLAGPTGLTASQGLCDSIRLNWTYDGGFPSCPGRDYKFLVYRDNFNNPSNAVGSVLVTNFSQTSFSFSDYRPPQGTSIVNHNYKVRLALVNPNNNALIQSSPLSNQATGYSRALPTAPNNLSVSYQGCAGGFTLNWQNPQLYDSVYVEITQNGGSTTTYKLDGSPTSYAGTIGTGVYSAVVKGVDECHRFAASAALPGITRPTGPGAFTLAAPTEVNGAISLDWTPSAGATSYKITRTGDGSKEITISDPNTTAYTDTDVKVCTQYNYKVTAINTCGTSMTATLAAPVIQQSIIVWTTQKVRGSKGYYGNRVELEWDAPGNFGFDHYKIYRTPLDGGTPQFLAVVDKNELRYIDYLSQAGVLYTYSISAYSECNGAIVESTAISDVGFRLPIAVVNGNVKFENGTGVDSVEITVERNSGTLGKGLHFNGQGTLTLHPEYVANPLQVLGLSAEMTIECWLKPEQLNGNFRVFEYVNNGVSYGLSYDAASDALVQYATDGTNGMATTYPVSLSTNDFTHLAWVRGPGAQLLYLNGEPLQGASTSYSSPGGSQSLRFGYNFVGALDEIRFWVKARGPQAIRSEYKNILSGDEDGLAAYWRIDEGVGNGIYDISGINETFHARHVQMNNNVTWSDDFPAGHQLGNRALTDSVGNYTIRNIRYSGVGNTFTVNPFYSPGGTPHEFDPFSTLLYLGEGNDVQNNVNFVDKSSFLVTGTILYSLPDSMCLNTRAFIYIDEQVAQVNGQPAAVDPVTGQFAIDVPIGRHRLSIKQAGHVFHRNGQWPEDGSLYDFQKDESGILFYDSTRVHVIGRVVGGTREAGKKLGFDKSVNNIGQAEITFSAQNGCHSTVVLTDTASGEYAVELLPFKYDVFISIPSNPGVDFDGLDVLDLSTIRPDLYEVDTVTNFGGQPIQYDSVLYNLKQNYVYRVPPSVDIADAKTGGPIRGDSIFIYLDPQTLDTTIIPLDELPWPVFLAGKRYPTVISAFEQYLNLDHVPDTIVDRVPVTDATVTINNGFGNASGTGQGFEEKFEIRNADGMTPYTFIGGQPEFIAEGDPALDFTQTLDLQLETPTHTISWRAGLPPFRGYVLGVKPDVGSSFVTEGPEVVDYILRDPPGDGSTAKFIRGETYTTNKSWFLRNVNAFETATKIKAGQAWFFGGGIVGIGFDTYVENDNNLEFSLKTSTDVDGNYVEAASFENEISTSGDPYFPGDESDVFLGKSQNFLFGGADELTLVNASYCDVITACIGPEIPVDGEVFRLGRRENMFVVPQGFKTTFVYSQWQIENYLIPNLRELRNALFADPASGYVSHLPQDDPGYGRNNDDVYFSTAASTLSPESTEIEDYDGPSYTYTYPANIAPNDRVRWYNQQIRLWEEALARNEKEKLQAKLMRNISFDAGASVSYTSSHSSTDTYNQRFEVALDTRASLAVGGFFAGSGGIFRFTLGVEIASGGSFSEETEVTNTYGYTLADGQPGDFLSIDVKDGGNGNSPVFSLRGGQTMCPWEQGYVTKYYNPGTPLSQSTIRRELPDLDVEPAFQNNVPEHQPARFTLKLRNASPTGDIQWYGLQVLDQTNPDGAVLSIDGVETNRVFEIPAGETVTKTLELRKAEANDYEIKLMLYSTCEYDAFQNGAILYSADTITVRAHFVPACSPVSVLEPVDLWVHNDDQGDTLAIQLADYLIQDPFLEHFKLQYKPSYTSVWKGIETIWKTVPNGSSDPQIPAASSYMTYLWNIEDLPDGPYDIRVVSHCTNTANDYASPPVSGIIDRIRPHAFGNPQPADGVLDPNDEIMIQFNETINAASLAITDIDVRAVLNGATLRHETSVELDGINDYVEVPAGTRVDDHPLTVELWIKRLSTGDDILWAQGETIDSALVFGINASNKLYFKADNTTVTSNAVVPADDQWYHVAVTLNENKQVNFYLTGIYYSGGFLPALYSIPGNMTFGKAAWANTHYFHGYMHEARIWRTDLTEGMIRTQMLKKLSGSENGLSLLWPMNEGTGTQLQEIVRKKHGTLLGNWAVLPAGYALDLNGTNYLRAAAGTMVFSDQHDFTLEFWLKGGKNGVYQTILSNGRGDGTDANEAGWSIKAGPDGRLLIYHGGQTSVGIDNDILDNNWHHVALALGRQGNLNCFLDGTLQSSVFGNMFGEFAGPYLWVGARGWFDGAVEMQDQKFGGALDEVRVWRSRLTSEQIRANMQHRLAGDEFGLELYLPFESYAEVGGIPVLTQTMTDQSPLQRTVTLVGSPQFQAEDPNIKLTAPFEKVNFTWSINDDKIIITPTTDPLRIERTTLFISLDNVEDVHGNEMAGPVNWVAFVNKNQLQWSEDELYFEKPEKEAMAFTAEITNSGGIELGFEILGLPDWLAATPAVGTIAPASSKTIRFTVSPAVRIGDYSTEISLLSGQGYNDKLAIDLHVFGVPPAWSVDPAQYPHSMTIISELRIGNSLSEDPLDRVAAFINGEVRGVAQLEYFPALDKYLAFLEVYSNVTSGENISFKAWDASTGTTYGNVNIKTTPAANPVTSIGYLANGLVGSAATPAQLIVTNDVIQEIPLNAGWTWISFNVVSSKFGNLDLFFDELTFENNDAIYSQTKNATYNPSTGWQGNLKTEGLDFKKMYKCDFTHADILRVAGPRVNPAANPISIAKGWNWIPFLSAETIEINAALNFNAPTAGDIVKSQDQVAVFTNGLGWVGTLTHLEPGKGYMLFADKAGSITFPQFATGGTTHDADESPLEMAIKWRNGNMPDRIEGQARNMTMIARLDSEVPVFGRPVIAAFADGVLLDLAQLHPVEGYEDLYYFTLQASGPDRMIYFEVYDAEGQYAGLAEEKIYWSADMHLGSLGDPYLLHLRADESPAFDAYPNPFEELLYVEYEAPTTGPVSIRLYDSGGRLVRTVKESVVRPGLQKWTLSGRTSDGQSLVTGVYTVEVIQGDTVLRRQLVRT